MAHRTAQIDKISILSSKSKKEVPAGWQVSALIAIDATLAVSGMALMSGQLKMRHDGMIYDANNWPVRHNWGESEKKKKWRLTGKQLTRDAGPNLRAHRPQSNRPLVTSSAAFAAKRLNPRSFAPFFFFTPQTTAATAAEVRSWAWHRQASGGTLLYDTDRHRHRLTRLTAVCFLPLIINHWWSSVWPPWCHRVTLLRSSEKFIQWQQVARHTFYSPIDRFACPSCGRCARKNSRFASLSTFGRSTLTLFDFFLKNE